MVRHTGVLWCMLIYQMNMGTGKLVDGTTTTNIILLGGNPLKGNYKETPAFLKRTQAF